ncbi:MAG: hypothetical protein GX265_02930, partial [Mollicutes bacterium]|nr:hypothetical protein [Mollicutes bacterium]
MSMLFVDTCIFEKKGLNFDKENIIINALLDCYKNGKFKFYNLSVIDNEIKNHIKLRADKDLNTLKKFKWLKELIDYNDIEKKCYKDMEDYESFKKNIGAINCNVSEINPELVFKKYFSLEFPFENKKDKRSEFPDAFTSEYLNEIKTKNEQETIYFITDDEGLKKSLNPSIVVYKSIEEFLKELNGIDIKEYSFIKKLIIDNLSDISSNILARLNLKVSFMESEIIEPDGIILNNKFLFDVINVSGDEIYVSCVFSELTLTGEFSCLDYNNSYWPNDEDYYTYIQYIKANGIKYEDVELEFKIIKKDNDYLIEYNNIYNLDINFDILEENANESFSPYD